MPKEKHKVLLAVNLTKRLPNIAAMEPIMEKVLSELSSGSYHSLVLLNSDKVFVKHFPETRVLSIKVSEDLRTVGSISVPTLDNDFIYLKLEDLDHLLPPKDFEFHIVGIDYNLTLSDQVLHLSSLGYECHINPNLIKTFKNLTYKKIRSHCSIANKE